MLTKRFGLFLPVAAALSLVAGSTPALGTPSATGDIHLVVTATYSLIHTVRHADGRWDDFYPLRGPCHSMSPDVQVAATVNGEENVVYRCQTGYPEVVHQEQMIRHADGSWTTSATPPAIAGSIGYPMVMAGVAGRLHLLEDNGAATMVQAVGSADGTWTQWQPTPVPAGLPAVAGAGSDLRVIEFAGTDASPDVMEIDQHADGSWSPPRTAPFRTDRPITGVSQLVVAQVGTDLQAVVLADNTLFHSVLHADGTWDMFRSVAPQTGDPGVVYSVAVAAAAGTLQVAMTTQGGGLFHTVRYPNGRWQRLGDVKDVIGDPGPVEGVSLAGD